MKIATWNVNSLKVRLPHVLSWLKTAQPDVLCLQEIKMVTEAYPFEALEDAGYQSIASGQKTYNGVAILSKQSQEDPITDFPGLADEQRRILATTIDGVRVLNVYVPNGQEVGSEKYDYKLKWFKAMHDFVAAEMKQYDKMVIVGDFNVAPDDRDVYDPKAWEGRILCSKPERDALQKIMDCGLEDAYRIFDQDGGTYSWWDYRTRAFAANRGLRIDLVLVSPGVAKTAKDCWVDIEPRSWERPSDHTPVVLEF